MNAPEQSMSIWGCQRAVSRHPLEGMVPLNCTASASLLGWYPCSTSLALPSNCTSACTGLAWSSSRAGKHKSCSCAHGPQCTGTFDPCDMLWLWAVPSSTDPRACGANFLCYQHAIVSRSARSCIPPQLCGLCHRRSHAYVTTPLQ